MGLGTAGTNIAQGRRRHCVRCLLFSHCGPCLGPGVEQRIVAHFDNGSCYLPGKSEGCFVSGGDREAAVVPAAKPFA